MALKSLVVGLLILAMWVRSYSVGDLFRRGTATQFIELGSTAGTVIIKFGHDGQKTRLDGTWSRVKSEEPHQLLTTNAAAAVNANADAPWHKAGFGYSREMITWPITLNVVTFLVPHWFMFLLAMPSAFLWLWRRLNRARSEGSVVVAPTAWCPTCQRELRNAVMVCPRCGGPVASGAFGAPSLVTR
jgi:hypothetical protein